MSSRRWKRAKATVELCERRRRHRDGTRITQRDRLRYAITISYPVDGDLYLTDVVSSKPLKEGSRVIVQYDPLDPRRNSLNHPRKERKAFKIALAVVAPILLILLVIALFGL
ncbi:MAG TPA: DUF3592 domain-containing protein [Bryocella sp.]|nr:DUF3592 domain-containing protein [Bryocella sp.]